MHFPSSREQRLSVISCKTNPTHMKRIEVRPLPTENECFKEKRAVIVLDLESYIFLLQRNSTGTVFRANLNVPRPFYLLFAQRTQQMP